MKEKKAIYLLPQNLLQTFLLPEMYMRHNGIDFMNQGESGAIKNGKYVNY